MKTINSIISEIRNAAAEKIGFALIDHAAAINSAFDDAYGSCLGGYYASGMECVAAGLKWLDELLEYADKIAATADGSSWEFARDALGSIKMEKAPLEQSIIDEYNLRIKRIVSPTFGDHPKKYIVKERKITVESENNIEFVMSENTGNLESAELYTLGAGYYWDKSLKRWVLDALINPSVCPHLAKYMK